MERSMNDETGINDRLDVLTRRVAALKALLAEASPLADPDAYPAMFGLLVGAECELRSLRWSVMGRIGD